MQHPLRPGFMSADRVSAALGTFAGLFAALLVASLVVLGWLMVGTGAALRMAELTAFDIVAGLLFACGFGSDGVALTAHSVEGRGVMLTIFVVEAVLLAIVVVLSILAVGDVLGRVLERRRAKGVSSELENLLESPSFERGWVCLSLGGVIAGLASLLIDFVPFAWARTDVGGLFLVITIGIVGGATLGPKWHRAASSARGT